MTNPKQELMPEKKPKHYYDVRSYMQGCVKKSCLEWLKEFDKAGFIVVRKELMEDE